MSKARVILASQLFVTLVGLAIMTRQSFCWIMGPILNRQRVGCNITPLMWACQNDQLSATKLLLDRGCAVNSVDDGYGGETALHEACRESSTECFKELLRVVSPVSPWSGYNYQE